MTKFQRYASALTIGMACAAPASAFEFTGSQASVQYHNWYTAGTEKAIGNANIGFELGGDLFGQVGATSAAILGPGGGLDFGSLEAHLGWHATETIDVGAFAGMDSYYGAGWPFDYHVGAEVAFSVAQIDGQVFAGRYFEAADPDLELFAGARLHYAMTDAFSIGAGAFVNSEPGNWTEVYLDANLRYSLNNGWFVDGIYSWQPQFGEHGVGVRVGYTFDRGVTFGNRDFTSLSNSFY